MEMQGSGEAKYCSKFQGIHGISRDLAIWCAAILGFGAIYPKVLRGGGGGREERHIPPLPNSSNSLSLEFFHKALHVNQFCIQPHSFLAQAIQLPSQVVNVGFEHTIHVATGDLLVLHEVPLGLQHLVLLLQEANLEWVGRRDRRDSIPLALLRVSYLYKSADTHTILFRSSLYGSLWTTKAAFYWIGLFIWLEQHCLSLTGRMSGYSRWHHFPLETNRRCQKVNLEYSDCKTLPVVLPPWIC